MKQWTERAWRGGFMRAAEMLFGRCCLPRTRRGDMFFPLSFLLGAASFAAQAAPISQVDQAESALTAATAQIAKQSYQSAVEYCKSGLLLVGNDDARTNADDDTGQKLLLARLEEHRRVDISANIYCGVLKDRIEMMRSKVVDSGGQTKP